MAGNESTSAAQDLYAVLGVNSNATQDEIKRAYRKKALQYHPDKNPGLESQFQEASTAFGILSDPAKRKVYDQFGMQGVTMSEAIGDDRKVLAMLGHMMLAGCILLVLITALLVQTILICLKFSGQLSAEWLLVFIPLFFCFAVVLALSLLVEFILPDTNSTPSSPKDATHSDTEDEYQRRPFCTILGSILLSIHVWTNSAAIVFFALLAIHLDSPSRVSVEAVGLVVLIWEAANLIQGFKTSCSRTEVRLQATEDDEDSANLVFEVVEVPLGRRFGNLVRVLLLNGLRVAAELCVLFKLNGSLGWSWTVVFIPAYTYLGGVCFKHGLKWLSIRDNSSRTVFRVVTIWVIGAAVTLALVAELQENPQSNLNRLEIVSPLLALVCLFIFLPCCLLCTFGCCALCCQRTVDDQDSLRSPLIRPVSGLQHYVQ
eukprot:c19156_g1_i1.p1 GENE.c19156_g1_i1~~c19156_g1_i1.p1  ORF type:complete len:430 (+),score=76.21 c19156_g1_i1:60-1349(+)